MSTFSKWLEMQQKRQDDVGEIGRIWAAAGQSGDRPKAHSPVGITNWFTERFHEQPELLERYKAAIGQGITEREREATAHLHSVPPAAGEADPVGSQIVEVLKAMQLLLESHSRMLEAVQLALGIDPVEGTVPPPEHLRPWIAAAGAVAATVTGQLGSQNAAVALGLPDGDLSTVWPQLWDAADHAAEAE